MACRCARSLQRIAPTRTYAHRSLQRMSFTRTSCLFAPQTKHIHIYTVGADNHTVGGDNMRQVKWECRVTAWLPTLNHRMRK